MNHEANVIFFVGIGGIGMSAVARFYLAKGAMVFGYDRAKTALTEALEREGAKIVYTEEEGFMPGNVDLVVRTPAVPKDNLYIKKAEEMGLPLMKRSEVLGFISKSYRCLAVAGTHGKTTTSTILTWLLSYSGLNPNAFLGGVSMNFGTNYLLGDSDWVVVEADEFDRSFLHLNPYIAVITSVEADHLDIYSDVQTLRKAFQTFAHRLTTGGLLVLHESVIDLISGSFDKMKVSYGFSDKADYSIKNCQVIDGDMVFDLRKPNGQLDRYRLPYAGKHNVENAVAAIIVAQFLGLKSDDLANALKVFKGIKRRFELIEKNETLIVIDDYAHHPSEIKAAISAAKMAYPGKKITGVFQPHLYSRTRDFLKEFAEELDHLDYCILVKLYAARELPIEGIDSNAILNHMRLKNKVVSEIKDIARHLQKFDNEVILFMGAGDVDVHIPEILKEYGIKLKNNR